MGKRAYSGSGSARLSLLMPPESAISGGILGGMVAKHMQVMPPMALKDTQIKAFKPAGKPFRRADEKGLYIEVFPNGSKLWRFKYRHVGLEKRLALGAYPEVSLASFTGNSTSGASRERSEFASSNQVRNPSAK